MAISETIPLRSILSYSRWYSSVSTVFFSQTWSAGSNFVFLIHAFRFHLESFDHIFSALVIDPNFPSLNVLARVFFVTFSDVKRPCSGTSDHNNNNYRSIGTVHTSAKARLTNVAIRILIRIRDPDCHQSLIICSLAHCQPSLKISCRYVWKFLHKVAKRQTDKQTNNDDYISFLADVKII